MSMAYTITGPYKYEGDLHPCFRVTSEDAIIACFYAADGNIDAAHSRAELYVNWQRICGCGACTPKVQHKSDCAVHNTPARRIGPCDCGAKPQSR